MKRRTFLASLALIPAIVACGSGTSTASITPFSGATPAQASDAPLAGELVAGLTSNTNEKASAAATLYRLPDDATYVAVKQYYADLLTAQVEIRIKKTVKRHGRMEEMGEVAIAFGSLDALNGIIDKLRVT
jgi:ParB family chromosome partitioning protein